MTGETGIFQRMCGAQAGGAGADDGDIDFGGEASCASLCPFARGQKAGRRPAHAHRRRAVSISRRRPRPRMTRHLAKAERLASLSAIVLNKSILC